MIRDTQASGEARQGHKKNDFLAAADWHTRLDEEDVPATVYAEFDAWLAADIRHRDSYRSIDRMWVHMGEHQADPRILDLRRDALNATRRRRRWLNIGAFSSLAIRGNREGQRADFSERRPVRFLMAAAFFLILCSAIFVGFFKLQDRIQGSESGNHWVEGGTFRTAIGERSALTMSDGSVIVLNTNTLVNINFSPKERHVRLMGGQAWFQVAKNPDRPFLVEAGGQRVTALGTAFDVRLADKDAVQVTLVEGRVTVVPIQSRLAALIGPPPKVSELEPGESLIATSAGPAARRKADVSKISSWRRGQVVFDNDSLDAAAAEINRYSHTQIVLADPALAPLRVSGVFTIGQSESFVETVIGHYPIRVAERTDDRIVLTAHARGVLKALSGHKDP